MVNQQFFHFSSTLFPVCVFEWIVTLCDAEEIVETLAMSSIAHNKHFVQWASMSNYGKGLCHNCLKYVCYLYAVRKTFLNKFFYTISHRLLTCYDTEWHFKNPNFILSQDTLKITRCHEKSWNFFHFLFYTILYMQSHILSIFFMLVSFESYFFINFMPIVLLFSYIIKLVRYEML